MTEDYVNFETAKLLKERGFDGPCYAYWHEDENKLIISQSMYAIQNITNPCFFGPAAPTLQMAMKWLRIEHNIHIEILMTNHSMSERFDIPKYYWVAVGAKTSKWITESTLYSAKQFDTNEEACEAAIKHCLEKLI